MAEEQNTTKKGPVKKKRKLRLKKEAKGLLAFIAVVGILLTALAFVKTRDVFVFEEKLPEIIVTVDETNLSLQEISYYIMKLEADVDAAAKLYNADNPKSYWNVYMNQDGSNSGYVSDLAKEAVLDYCIRDNIYYKEAIENGYTLPEALLTDIRYDAENLYNTMTPRQREVTKLTSEQLAIIMEKEEISHQYMIELASRSEAGMLQSIFLEYDVGGDLYEQVKLKHNIAIDEDLWGKVKVGRITINYE